MTKPSLVALIVAGGKGTRARTGGIPKQYASLGGEPVLRRTLRAFAEHPAVDAICVVIGSEDQDLYERAAADLPKLIEPVEGGTSRQQSVFNGLKALEALSPERVLIHDGARPFVSSKTISSIADALFMAEGAIAALPVADTLKLANGANGIEKTIPREGLWRAQTPQGFRFQTILTAHEDAEPDTATDDASILEAKGIHVSLVADEPTNIKLTYVEDFDLAEKLIAASMETRTGLGFDVHAFEDGESVILGGVEIPHTHKLKGHSDADVGLHAITDAILGAIGEGDIGQHFPPSDDQWKGAPSSTFLKHAGKLVADRRGEIRHIDLTLIAEAPKVGPHREAIRTAIADMLGLDLDRVSVKATTTEKLGFTGRKEGIAAQAIATVAVPRK